jgi:hypothetical protein
MSVPWTVIVRWASGRVVTKQFQKEGDAKRFAAAHDCLPPEKVTTEIVYGVVREVKA